MADTHETIAGITAEIRARAGVWMDDKLKQYDERLADRLDLAHKREVSTTKESLAVGNSGDCAKLREALIKAITMLAVCEWPDGTNMEGVEEVSREIDAALDAPPRNCDRFATETDAHIAFLREVWLIGVSNLDRDPFDGWTNEMKSAYSKWLFAPATEKEGGDR
jgi:hypothetical protein